MFTEKSKSDNEGIKLIYFIHAKGLKIRAISVSSSTIKLC